MQILYLGPISDKHPTEVEPLTQQAVEQTRRRSHRHTIHLCMDAWTAGLIDGVAQRTVGAKGGIVRQWQGWQRAAVARVASCGTYLAV